MTLLIPPGYAQAAFRFSLTGDPQVMVTTLGVEVSGNGQTEADELRVGFTTAIPVGGMNDGWTFLGVRLYVGQDGGPPAIVDSAVNHVGIATPNGLPTNCAFLINKQTNRGGRGGRGRCYLPFVVGAEGDVDQNGMIEPATVDAVQDAWDVIVQAVSPVLLHDDQSPGSQLPDVITGFVVQNQIATQRRRMRS